MNISFLVFSLIFSMTTYSQKLNESDLKPYNNELNFKILDENDLLEKNESIEAVIFVFNKPMYKNAERSISNNPQLKEIKLFGSSQELLTFISDSKLPKLTHLFFKRYKGSVLEIPPFPILEHLTIQSLLLVSLNMEKGEMNKLDILDINAPKLRKWKSAESIPNLGLIELKAPLLDSFPIVHMPKITQFYYECSFKVLPENLCDYADLSYISFNNYCPVQIDACIKKKIKQGVYSNLTVYDQIHGKILSEVESKDRKE